MKDDLVKNRIIDATVECIGKYGLESITNRLIAKEANVNSAAISYYFGSKEDLISEAVKRSLDSYLSEFLSMEQNEETNPKLVLQNFMREVLKDSIAKPHFLKSYLYDPILHNDYSGIFIEKFNAFLNSFSKKSNLEGLGKTEAEIKMSIVQIVSSLLFISLLPDFYHNFIGDDFTSSKFQDDYIQSLMNRYGL